jgi:membrane-anchored protein YejM (alkaline phosphatase superfamily)
MLLRWTGWFIVGNTALLLLVAARDWQSAGWPAEWPARCFLVICFLGHFFTWAAVAALPVSVAVLLWPSRLLAGVLAVILSGLATLLVIVDSVVFHLYRFHLNGMVWSLVSHGNVTQELPLSPQTWSIAGLLVVMVLIAEIGLTQLAWYWTKRARLSGPKVAAVFVLAVVVTQLAHAYADAAHYRPITRIPRNLPACRPLTARRTLQKLGLAGGSEDSALPRIAHSGLKYPLESLVSHLTAKPFNVVILAIDCWRFDVLTEAVMPNLFAFSQRNLRFEQHSSAANATRFGIFTLFYGIYGTYWHAMLAEERGPVLIEEFKKNGYQFSIWGAAPLNNPEFNRTVFSELRQQLTIEIPGNSQPDRDKEITRRFLKFLDDRERERPFFAFLFYDSTHAYDYPPDAPAPFQPVCRHVEHLRLGTQDPQLVRNRFLNAAHFVDSVAAQVLRRLERDGLLDSTVVLVTGDHGEEFNDTGQNLWGHNDTYTRYQTGVPLIVHLPGKGARVFSHATTHLDIAPTLLQELLLYTNAPRTFSNGTSLFDTAPRTPLVIGNWSRFGLLTPGRIDEIFDNGQVDHYDEQWRPITTSIPANAIPPAMEGMSRFYAR